MTITGRQFDQITIGAKRASSDGPVLLADRVTPAPVLLGTHEYQHITGQPRNVVEALSMQGLSDIEVAFPGLREVARPADL